MNKEDLKSLQNKQDDPCVSVIVPTHRISTNTKEDHIRLKNAIKRVSESLHEQYDKKKVTPLIERLEKIVENELDYANLLEGLGIFISPNLEKIVHIPFEVEERVIVDTSFEVRDLLLSLNRELDYNVLLLSENNIRFFQGKGRNLMEIQDEQFQENFSGDEYEYQKANFINPAKGSPEGTAEKANEEQKKMKEFLKHLDNKLGNYINTKEPLFLLGDKQILGEFTDVTHHPDAIQGKLPGNFQHLTVHEVADKVQTEVKRYMHEHQEKALRNLEEEVGFDRVSSGLPNVYRDAIEGKGATLLVEEGYSEPAYLDETNYQLALSPENTEGYKKLHDAVDDVIEKVLEKNGTIQFVQNGKLQKYGKIAMILRYHD